MNASIMRGALAVTAFAFISAIPVPAVAQDVPVDFTGIVSELSPTVVAVAASRQTATPQTPQLPPEMLPGPFGGPRMPDQQPPGDGSALGSGFIISEEGHIVTNNHVIQDATEIEVLTSDGSSIPAELVGTDAATDIAVLKIEPSEQLAIARWGDSDALQPGAWTIAIGSPFGLGGTVTVGVLSARSRDITSGLYEGFLQTDASINQGNSGGPLFNVAGEVIGVNTAIFSPVGANIGIGFSVPSNTAQSVVSQLIETGRVERGFIGVSLQPVTESIARALGLETAQGAIIADVEPGSPGEDAGLQTGDVVLSIGGSEVEDPRDLARAVTERDPGSEVTLSIYRGGDRMDVDVTLAEREEPEIAAGAAPGQTPDEGGMGLAVTEIPELLRRQLGLEGNQGVIIQRVAPGSPAAEAGLMEGDVILQAADQPIRQAADLEGAWESAQEAQRPVLLQITRADATLFVAVETGSG